MIQIILIFIIFVIIHSNTAAGWFKELCTRSCPRLTVNRLAITALADLYFVFGMFVEERRFVKIFGDQYWST